jgi:hypothetical protein
MSRVLAFRLRHCLSDARQLELLDDVSNEFQGCGLEKRAELRLFQNFMLAAEVPLSECSWRLNV